MCLCICFPTSSQIRTLKTGSHLISDISPFTPLLSAKFSKNELSLKEDTFYTYLHFDPNLEGSFLKIRTENGKTLTISHSHLLFKNAENLEIVPAQSIKIGDELITHSEEQNIFKGAKVVDISEMTSVGVFAPMTKNGTMIVDDFLVSCYAGIESHELAHRSLAPLRLWYKNKQKGDKKWSQKTKKHDGGHGIHGYPRGLMSIYNVFTGERI